MQQVLENLNKKIAKSRNTSFHSRSRNSNSSFVLSRRTVKNALSRNRNMNVAEKLNLMKSFESIKNSQSPEFHQTQKLLSATLTSSQLPPINNTRKIHKKSILILKKRKVNPKNLTISCQNPTIAQQHSSASTKILHLKPPQSPLLSTYSNSSIMLPNVNDLLCPSASSTNISPTRQSHFYKPKKVGVIYGLCRGKARKGKILFPLIFEIYLVGSYYFGIDRKERLILQHLGPFGSEDMCFHPQKES